MLDFSFYGYYKKNKYKFMIIGSILLILLLFIFKHLSDNNKRVLVVKTKQKMKGMNRFMTKFNTDRKMYDEILNDILGEDEILDLELPKKKRFMPQVSKGELACKIYVEKLFGKSFEKIRPEILKNKVTGQNLEIDLYNDELKLGIEYNGLQHYKYCPGIHKNYEHFQTQKYRDEMKKMMCKEAGITLIEVPYNEKDIPSYLFQLLSIAGFSNRFI